MVFNKTKARIKLTELELAQCETSARLPYIYLCRVATTLKHDL